MPNPVPLATKEEEERRAWVTAHHEVVRLIKECFGDRFSNNEIFDRLKISRRTGYRALGNDERIGKAPGRKPKILDNTVKEMIEYIESGGCSDVGNVWKHLAEKYAPDCNPKTVQDAVKKSGFRNYHSNVKLEPLLNEQLPDNAPAPDEEEAARQLQEENAEQQRAQQQVDQAQQAEHAHREQQAQQQQQVQNVFDPALQQQGPHEFLRHAIANFPQDYVRLVLSDITTRNQDAMIMAHHLFTQAQYDGQQPGLAPMAQLAVSAQPALHALQTAPMGTPNTGGSKRRVATCRRCGLQFDRTENKMENRECLYHKGSPQKIDPSALGTIQQAPEAFIWSCCGGNGAVRGCCRAMHTTKKKRKYSSKKRTAGEAGLDGDADGDDGNESADVDETELDKSTMLQSQPHAQMTPQQIGVQAHQQLQNYHPVFNAHLAATVASNVQDPNIDSSLQDNSADNAQQQQHTVQSAMHSPVQMDMADQMEGAPQANMHTDENGANGDVQNADVQNADDADLSQDIGAQLQAATNGQDV